MDAHERENKAMQFTIEIHGNQFFVTPALIMETGECGDPSCPMEHYRLAVSFLLWTVAIVF